MTITSLLQLLEQAQWLAFRVSNYAALNFMDDPAMLAIVFC